MKSDTKEADLSAESYWSNQANDRLWLHKARFFVGPPGTCSMLPGPNSDF